MSAAKLRVLVVDDDLAVRESVAALLGTDFYVRTCDSGRMALDLLASEIAAGKTFHVVCVDWHMPEMDGMEFFRQLTRRSDWPCMSCIIITSHIDELTENIRGDEGKTLGFVKKPFDPARFISRVRHYASLTEMKRGIQASHQTAKPDR